MCKTLATLLTLALAMSLASSVFSQSKINESIIYRTGPDGILESFFPEEYPDEFNNTDLAILGHWVFVTEECSKKNGRYIGRNFSVTPLDESGKFLAELQLEGMYSSIDLNKLNYAITSHKITQKNNIFKITTDTKKSINIFELKKNLLWLNKIVSRGQEFNINKAYKKCYIDF